MQFEKKLRATFKVALVAALLHKSTAWLGAGALTWATVVLMGGFASAVAVSDFILVTLLVLAIACLLALARFFSKLVTKKTLSTGSLDPVRLTYRDKQPGLVRKIGIVSCVVQFCLILPCLCLATRSIQRPEFKTVYFHYFRAQVAGTPLQACLQACLISTASTTVMASCARSCLGDDQNNASGNLQVCLFTFFLLVIFTCSFAALCLLYILGAKAWWRLRSGSRSVSLRRYHDEVLSRALHLGLVEADEFDAKAFLLLALGEDLALRNIGPLEVKKRNADFVKYLYHHPKGVEMVHQGLESEDTLMQQTAANMVGFWAKEPGVEKQAALLSRLADKLGQPGKAAEGAANSFSSLAAAWAEYKQLEPCPLLNIYCESTITTRSQAASPRPPSPTTTTATANVVDTVINLVLERWAPTLQVYLRALDSFFMSSSVLGNLDQNQRRRLDDKLVRIIQNTDQATRSNPTTKLDIDPRTKPRTRFLAFSALYRLRALGDRRSATQPQGTSMKELLKGIDRDLKDQKFLWIQEAERYRELCTSVGIEPGPWLQECQIRGKEHVD